MRPKPGFSKVLANLKLNINKGAVHKVRHAIFGQFLPPSPCHTSSHIPGPPESTSHISDPPPIFRRLSTKNPDKSSFVQILSQLFAGGFVRGEFVRGPFMSGRFCPGWFLFVPFLSEYICYFRKLNITLNFMFRMYD